MRASHRIVIYLPLLALLVGGLGNLFGWPSLTIQESAPLEPNRRTYTADQGAEQLARLYELGMDGVLIEFLHYYEDMVRFGKEIVPRLRQMGVVA